MSDGKKIEFTYGNAKAQFNPETHKLEFEGDDDSKLRNGIIGIFNAIKKIGGDPKKIDQGLETTLLNNLQSIFDAGKTTAIDDDEMDWARSFERGNNVDEFIRTKHEQVTNAKQESNGEVNNDEQVQGGGEVNNDETHGEGDAETSEAQEEVTPPKQRELSTLPSASKAVEMPTKSEPGEPFDDPVMLGRRKVAETKTSNRLFGWFGKKELKYDENGKLISKTIIRTDGTKKREIVYNKSEERIRQIKYNRDGEATEVLEYIDDGNNYEYNEDGKVIGVTEYDNGKPKRTTRYHNNGKVCEIADYDQDGNKTKNTMYNKLGILSEIQESQNGKVVRKTDYSNSRKPTITEYDENNRVTKDAVYYYKAPGYYVVAYNEDKSYTATSYNKEGEPTLTREYDKDLKLVKSFDYKENQVREYNAEGRTVRAAQLDSNGAPVSTCEYEYDENGYCSKLTLIDSAGNARSYDRFDGGNQIIEKDETGFVINEYDTNGKETKYTNFDIYGNVTGYTTYEYNDNGIQTKVTSYDKDEKLTSIYEYNDNGIQTKETNFNADGSIKSFNTWDDQGRQVRNGFEDHYYIYKYDGDSENRSKITKYDLDNNVTGYTTYEYNDNGIKTKETKFNADESVDWFDTWDDQGRRVRNDNGNHYYIYEYDGDSENRSKSTEYNSDNKLKGYTTYEYNDNGIQTKVTNYDKDEKLTSIYEYNEYGIKIKQTNYDKDGKVTSISEYNENGIKIKRTYFKADGSVDWFDTWDDQGRQVRNGYASFYYIYKYDGDSENISKSTKYDSDDNVTGYTTYEYNDNDKLTKMTNYDKDEKLTSTYEFNENGIKTKETSFNADESVDWFDTWDDQGRKVRDGHANFYYIYEYDGDSKNRSKSTEYDLDNNVTGYTTYEYNDNGMKTKETIFNADESIKSFDTWDDQGRIVRDDHGDYYYIYEYDGDSKEPSETRKYRPDGTLITEQED